MDEHALNILLVDDDEVDVMTVQRAFAKANIANKVFVAGDGIEALQLLRTDGVPTARRLVLLDLNMPRMNGLELCMTLRGAGLAGSCRIVSKAGRPMSSGSPACVPAWSG